MERVTRRIKESSESRGRRPFSDDDDDDDDEEDDDDAFLSGNMAGSSGKRKSKSHPCVVRLPVEPDRRSPESSSPGLLLRLRFGQPRRSTERRFEPDRPIKSRKNRIRQSERGCNFPLAYRPSNSD
ncbi:hypothetical protein K0M31_016520 [Melipona bicolor]|uniref:Uncharacterized protein n=1 Tax=Melipona bicolor TaxID=60889 RepID=A0AA40G7B0_9HYME|nr:hypothetical protein K0M31_016520 [Melipona bicolor]